MGIAEVLLVSVGLSLDVFAYAVYKGALLSRIDKWNLVTMCALFGLWQMSAVLAGNLIGRIPLAAAVPEDAVLQWHMVSAVLFLLIGFYLLVKSRRGEPVMERKEDEFNWKQMCAWAAVTSVDSFLAGISFGFLDTEVFLTIPVIGMVTVAEVLLGVAAGYYAGGGVRNKARAVGGIMLLVAGFLVVAKYIS